MIRRDCGQGIAGACVFTCMKDEEDEGNRYDVCVYVMLGSVYWILKGVWKSSAETVQNGDSGKK